jgi:serine/threonine protein kinase
VCVVYEIGPIILCGSKPRETTLLFSFNESEHCQSVCGAGIKVKYILMYTLKSKNLEYCFYTEKLKKKILLFSVLFHPQAEGCIFLVLEFCAGGNLASFIRLHGRVQEQIARGFMQQLGNTFAFLAIVGLRSCCYSMLCIKST